MSDLTPRDRAQVGMPPLEVSEPPIVAVINVGDLIGADLAEPFHRAVERREFRVLWREQRMHVMQSDAIEWAANYHARRAETEAGDPDA